MVSDRELMIWLLRKLARQNCWGKGHMSADDLAKGQPRNIKKMVLDVADKMVKKGFLVRFPHAGEKHYYLNPHLRKEIRKIIEES